MTVLPLTASKKIKDNSVVKLITLLKKCGFCRNLFVLFMSELLSEISVCDKCCVFMFISSV